MAYTFLQIVEAIKEEGRVNTSTDLDTMIKRIVNESIIRYSRNKEFPELYVDRETITITSDEQSQFTFPATGGKIIEILYSTDDLYYRPLKQRNQFPVYSISGYPEWYYRSGANLFLSPSDQILTTHYLKISYYKRHPALAADSDLLLVDDLYPTIVAETLGRLARYHNHSNEAQIYKQDALQSAGLIQQ